MSDGPSNDPYSWTEYGWTCSLCGHDESWTTELSSKLSIAIHIRDVHPERLGLVSRVIIMALRVRTPPPERYGRKLHDWESQR